MQRDFRDHYGIDAPTVLSSHSINSSRIQGIQLVCAKEKAQADLAYSMIMSKRLLRVFHGIPESPNLTPCDYYLSGTC